MKEFYIYTRVMSGRKRGKLEAEKRKKEKKKKEVNYRYLYSDNVCIKQILALNRY